MANLKRWFVWPVGAVLVILFLVIVGVYKELHRWSGMTPDKNKFDISFMIESTKTVPNRINHGNGRVVSVTIKDWDPGYEKKFQDDGVYVIPTSVNPSQRLSFFSIPPTPNGLQGTIGGGPSSFTNAVDKYFRKHHWAQLQNGQMTDMTSIHGTFKNVTFTAAIGNGGSPSLQASDIRLVILDVRERENQFKVMWSKVYSPSNLSH